MSSYDTNAVTMGDGEYGRTSRACSTATVWNCTNTLESRSCSTSTNTRDKFCLVKSSVTPTTSISDMASSAGLGTVASLGGSFFLTNKEGTKVTAKFDLKPPPYPLNALEPIMSQRTLEFHWGKHHRSYVDNLKKQVVGTELDGKSLEEIIVTSYNQGDILPAFNNAAQVWNHDFFWECMKPGGGGKPSGDLLQLIERDFGSFEKFSDEFKTAAATQFGSGWAWLAYKASKLDVGNAVSPIPLEEDNKLVVLKSPNAVNPLVWGCYFPILTIDVWEHAYYLDFQNRRPDYISVFMEKLVSWDAASSRLEQAKALIAKA